MSVNERVFNASPQAVWAVLSDGWLYPLWVVGATRMREVDDTWPQKGSRLHHSVGVWPAVINDYTEVLEVEPLRRLVLRARAWPMGEAKVVLELEGLGSTTKVRIIEDPSAGPGQLVPSPVREPMLKWRNVEALGRLAHLVEGRAHEGKA
ncbi:MAG TPA: SRPBCC domain-containing protein [Marmoricola sp.]|nr:SRPBCC domain-containing protein [Marmoricola sp.]